MNAHDSDHRCLYTGLDPSRYRRSCVHVPFIATHPLPDLQHHMEYLFQYDSILVTSRMAATLLFQYVQIHTTYYAVGHATAAIVKEYGFSVLTPKWEQAEGICALWEEMPPRSIGYPHAAEIRPVILPWLEAHHIPFYAFPAYWTERLRPDPLPCLEEFDEVIFTSPSTVDAFFACYPHWPEKVRFCSLGAVTQTALERYLNGNHSKKNG